MIKITKTDLTVQEKQPPPAEEGLKPTIGRIGIGGVDVHLGPLLLDIIDQQSMQGLLLVTSQFHPGKWYNLFNDPSVADAILDRIVHRAHFMEPKGESMRKIRAKKD